MQPLLEIKNLVTGFFPEPTVNAVNGVSFSLKRGQTLGLVGESGSGKSVTALSIMRLVPPPGKIHSGEVFFHDGQKPVNLLTLPENEMRPYRGRRIAMIFQEPMSSLNPVFTCGYQVDEAIRLHQHQDKKESKQRTLALFEKVSLKDSERIYNSYPHQLSGGQKQRVMIAMAISCNPDLLIADEPTSSLDVTVQASILSLLKDLQKESGMSMIFITHDLNVVAQMANQIAVMYKGKIVEAKPVSGIFQHPEHPYTKGLLACKPPLGKRLEVLPTISDFMIENADGSFTELPGSYDSVYNRYSIRKEKKGSDNNRSPFLKVENLKLHFPVSNGIFGRTKEYIKAVDDVSFDVFAGETLGLVGESGSGKSTLGKSIIRLLEPTGGRVSFNGIDLATLEGRELRKVRRELQIVFQDSFSSLNPSMTAGESIEEPMKVHRLYESSSGRKKKTVELLHKVGLGEEYYSRFPYQLSGGQRQRICIARALALQPRLIICDECVSALDVSIQAQVLNLLNELKKDFGFTYIFISHDLSVVQFMSDRIAVMQEGRLVELGAADSISANPQTEYTRRLIEAIPKAPVVSP